MAGDADEHLVRSDVRDRYIAQFEYAGGCEFAVEETLRHYLSSHPEVAAGISDHSYPTPVRASAGH